MLKSRRSLVLAFCLTSIAAFSQPHKLEKWGKIPEEDLQMTHYPLDSQTAAVVLQDVGTVGLTHTNKGWRVMLTYGRRLKILDVAALKEGNLEIFYRSDRRDEIFSDLEVQVTLPNGERQKVKSDNVFTEKINRYYSAKKVFIPNLQKGSIIEYRYERQSEDYLTMYDWYFQGEFPVRWSQLKVTVPQYFEYVYLTCQPKRFDLAETEEIDAVAQDGSRYRATVTTYGFADLPALREEPYVTTIDDYRAHINFQLSKVHFPGQLPELVMTSWANLAKDLEGWESFGKQYSKSDNYNKLWDAFRGSVPPGTPKEQLPEKALRFVTDNIEWNGENRVTCSESLDEAFAKKTGSTAQLNLAVVALLRKSGLDAQPMLISTRNNGAMFDQYPFIGQFNTVVAFVRQGEAGVVLDATNPFRPPNELRGQCYNGGGWIADKDRPDWVDLSAPEMSETWLGQMSLQEDGSAKGTFSIVMGGPIATDWRADLEHASETDFLKKHFAASFPDIAFDSIIVSERDVYDKPLRFNFNCSIPNAGNGVNEFLYVRPVLDFFLDENPFKSPKRIYPVNFTYPLKAQYVLNLQLPPGYQVEELPEAARIGLPNNAGRLQFACSKVSEKEVQLVLKASISKLDFGSDEYEALRKYFDFIAEKTQMQLVLKKT
jgi:hypothetical protein